MSTSLYRMFDAEGALLYVGISSNPGRRIKEHAKGQSWWSEVRRITVEHFRQRRTAERAERQAIATEAPRFNVMHVVASIVQPAVEVVAPSPAEQLGRSWFTATGAARRVGCSYNDVLRLLETGRLNASRSQAGRVWRVPAEAVLGMMTGAIPIYDPCPVCESSGPWKSATARSIHVRSHHKVECPECGVTISITGLVGHRVTRHGYRRSRNDA